MAGSQVRRRQHEYAQNCSRADEGLEDGDDLQRLAQTWLVGQESATSAECTEKPPHTVDLVRF